MTLYASTPDASTPANVGMGGAPAGTAGAPQPPPTQPLWIGTERPVFAMYHAPAQVESHKPAVLFCAPFGWADMGSYPSRRIWAECLARAGHPVLRFDLPGTGQSVGGPRDPGQLDSWLRAIVETACWLRHASDSPRVAGIGIGLGALLALHALAADAAIDDLVLWGTPASGRALTRSLWAFAKLQTVGSEREDRALPPGWLQTGGYLLSGETLADLGGLRTDRAPVGRLRRALLLSEDDDAVNMALATHLRQAGVEVQTEPGPGYGAMLHDPDSPQFSVVPDATIATVGAWLRPMRSATPAPGQAIPATGDQLEIECDGSTVHEHAFTVTSSSGTMFGVLAEPAVPTHTADDCCLICLPTWAERCIGPNRLWVELARRYAARGMAVLRIDLESIGDSDGVPKAVRTAASVFDDGRPAQIQRAMDALSEAGHGSRFLLAGLCAGGYWAQRATIDPRVTAVLSLNPSPSPSGRALLLGDAARQALLIFRPSWWRAVTRGEASLREALAAGKAIGRIARARMPRARDRATQLLARSRDGGAEPDTRVTPDATLTMTALFDRVGELGTKMTLGFSDGEPTLRVLELEGVTHHLERWPALRLHRFETPDHGLRAIDKQQEALALADALVEDALHQRRGEH
jgi:alpha-beta hydrolase superfamily lysophospholipase